MATFIYVAQQADFDAESVPDVEILLKRWVDLDLVGVWFASGVDAALHSSDCWVRALLVEPVSAELEAIGVSDKARERDSAIRELCGHDLVDGVAFEARKHVGNSILCALDVLDDDRVFEQRRNPAADARAGFGFFREQQGQRLVINAQDERPREQMDTEVGNGGDNSETFSLKRRIVLLRRQMLLRKNIALDPVV